MHTDITKSLITAVQLSKDTTLAKVEGIFKVKFQKSIDASYFCQIDHEKSLFFYKFAVVVFVGYSHEEVEYYFEQLGGKLGGMDRCSERYEVIVNPHATKDFSFDDTSITVPEKTPAILEITAFALAHSAAMDFYEQKTEELLQKMNFHEDLKTYGKIKISDREALRLIAEILSIKHKLVSELYLFDKPDIIWDDIRLEKFYNGLYGYFDINDRFKSIEYKINLMNDNITFLHDVIDTRKAHILEIVVIFLISFEILFTLIEFFGKHYF